MCKLHFMLLVLATCTAVFASEEESDGFVLPLDFAPVFGGDDTGIASLASSPISAALLKVDKSQYPQLFDTVVSSSIDSLHKRIAPEDAFSAQNFGFNPIASQSFVPGARSAKLVAQPKQHQRLSPLSYDIRTVHDAVYKVWKPEDEQGEEILAALKKDPAVSSYFQPQATNLEVAHPVKYRTQELTENSDSDQNYKHNAFIPGPSRIRRYAGGRKKEYLRKRDDDEEDEDDPYHYKAEYVHKPKAFDSELYSSAYKEDDPKKEYEYPYKYDSGYDHKEYERIKELSEKQAAEIKQNPGNCKEVKKDGMSCMVCKDPKTGGNYESCSYVAEPKNNKYAYSKEKKFDSNDEPDEPENDQDKDQPEKLSKYEGPKDSGDKSAEESSAPEKPYSEYKKEKEDAEDDDKDKYKGYYVHSSNPKPSSEHDSSEDKSQSLTKPYNYKAAIPGFYSDTEPKKDVEHVLAEFKKKDRSSCKKVQKNGMTCFQCVDKSGLKHEECMFVSESAPKRSHLAYQELKEFTSRPETVAGTTGVVGTQAGAESQTVTTSAPAAQRSAAYVVANSNYGKKLKRKKTPHATIATAATSPVAAAPIVTAPLLQPLGHKTKRSVDAEAEANAEIVDETNVAPPEEFAGDSSKGAFWAETMPRYSAALGVTLPEFMLARSEHEASFDETVAGA